MTWIKTVNYADASGQLKALYDRVKGTGVVLRPGM